MLAAGKIIFGFVKDAVTQAGAYENAHEAVEEQRLVCLFLDTAVLIEFLDNKICGHQTYHPHEGVVSYGETENTAQFGVRIPDYCKKTVHIAFVLYVETEMHYVTVLNHIVLTLHIEFAGITYGSLGAQFHVVIVLDDLGTDKALLKIGMDNTCALRCLPAFAVGPCLYLHGSGGDECLQVQTD